MSGLILVDSGSSGHPVEPFVDGNPWRPSGWKWSNVDPLVPGWNVGILRGWRHRSTDSEAITNSTWEWTVNPDKDEAVVRSLLMWPDGIGVWLNNAKEDTPP